MASRSSASARGGLCEYCTGYLHLRFFLTIGGRGPHGLTATRQERSSPRAIVRSSHTSMTICAAPLPTVRSSSLTRMQSRGMPRLCRRRKSAREQVRLRQIENLVAVFHVHQLLNSRLLRLPSTG